MNKDEPLVSVIIPTYNSEEYIEELLDSILNQSYKNFKIIISDDASEDSTQNILKEYKRREPEKFVLNFNKENQGLVGNINRLIPLTSGDYIACADHDDIWRKEKLEKQVEFLENNRDYIACSTDRELITSEGKTLVNSRWREKHGIKKETDDFTTPLSDKKNWRTAFNTLMFRNEKSSVDKVFPIPREITQADYWIVSFLSLDGKIGYIYEPLVKYRIHKNNLSGNYMWRIGLNYRDLKKKFKKQIERYEGEEDSKIINRKLEKMDIDPEIRRPPKKRTKKIKDFLKKRVPFLFIYLYKKLSIKLQQRRE